MRRAAKIDRNQPEIVAALRAVGCTVQPLHTVGQGVPDLLVGVPRASGQGGVTLMVEVKDHKQPPSARRLTEDQLAWHAAWNGGPLAVVCDVESALRAVKVASE